MRDIVILGAGGQAREVAFLIEEINKVDPSWRILGFVEIERELVGKKIGKYRVVCAEEDLLTMEVSAVIAIGDPTIVKNVASRLTTEGSRITFPNLVHPNVVWDQDGVILGRGNIVCAGSVLTTGIKVGSFNFFNSGLTMGHDVDVSDFCVFNPGANISGGVRIGSQCLVGAGAVILQYRRIGKGVTVGAGAVVTKNVGPGATVVGVPAKPVRER